MARDRCPECDFQELKTWDELNEEEREIVKRLPATAAEPLAERLNNRWCTRCWYEEQQAEREA